MVEIITPEEWKRGKPRRKRKIRIKIDEGDYWIAKGSIHTGIGGEFEGEEVEIELIGR